MPTVEEIDQQRELLANYRRTLVVYLKRQAILGGPAYVPPEVAFGIREAHENIRRIKTVLRAWGESVEDHPDDEDDFGAALSPNMSSHSYGGFSIPYPSTIARATRMIVTISMLIILLVFIIYIISFLARYIIPIGITLVQRVSPIWLLVGLIILTIIGVSVRLWPLRQVVRSSEQASTTRITIGFFGITLLLFFIIVQIIALVLPATIHYMIDVESANTPSKPEITALFTLFTLIVSAGSGLAAGRARRLLQALGIIVLSVALMLVVLVFLWNTPSVRAAEPSALPGLATAPYRAELLIDGPQSIRMWSSAPITLTVSVITNTVETAWPLPHSGPYTATVAIQENSFSLAKNIDKIQQPQSVSLGRPASWIWGIEPNDPYYDNQLVILNLTVADKGGTVSSPHSFMYINVTFFGFPGWVRLVGLAIGGLATIFGVKDIIIRFIPERQAIPQQVPASSVPTSPPSIPQEVMHTILPTAAAAPPQAPIPDEVKPKRKKSPKN